MTGIALVLFASGMLGLGFVVGVFTTIIALVRYAEAQETDQ